MTDLDMPPALRQALAHHQAGEHEQAEQGYLGVIEEQPDNLDALHLLSVLRLQEGRPEDALIYIERVIHIAPDAAEAFGNKGTALQAMERYGEAAFAFRTAIKHDPQAAHHHYNLGNTLRASEDKPSAVLAYRDALKCAPDLVQAHSNLATTLSELGLFDEAITHCQTALKLDPKFADAHYNLGNAHRESGRFDAALLSYEKAIEHNPAHADAFCNKGLTEMLPPGLDTAIHTLGQAIAVDPDQDMARFYHAVATEMIGSDAQSLFEKLPGDDQTVDAWLDSWTYVKSHSMLDTEIIHDPFALLEHTLSKATLEGLALEFGVRHGLSIRHIAQHCSQAIHGFDSFRGLPSAWGGEPEGVYTTEGALPAVPENVTLHEGLFEDTLGTFLGSHPGDVRFCNIDCDIYASTVTVLDALAPRIKPGTVLVFDEYLINPTWRDDEFKAFGEAVAKYGWQYHYIAFGIVTKQAAIIIDKI